MDIRRPDRHFNLSSNPRQPRVQTQPVEQVQVSQNPVQSASFQPQQISPPAQSVELAPASPEKAEEVPKVDYVSPPPQIPEAEPPVIESMQTQPETIIQPNTPSPATTQNPEMSTNKAATKPKREPGTVKTRYVVAGAAALLLILIGSVVWQQLAIKELKFERQVLGEQVKNTNPISVGANGSSNNE